MNGVPGEELAHLKIRQFSEVLQALKVKKVRNRILVGIAAIVALQIFFVRQLLAALLLFTIAFAIFALIALLLYIIDRVGQWSVAWLEKLAQPIAQMFRRAWNQLETNWNRLAKS